MLYGEHCMQHLAMIMDGNRRWAKKEGFETLYHRQKSVEAVRTAAQFCIKHKIKILSLYMLSLENSKNRALDFLDNIFRLTIKTCYNEADALFKEGVKICFIGNRELYPKSVLPAIKHVEETTKDCTALCINLYFYYGGRQEIVHAATKLAEQVRDGTLSVDQIDEKTLQDAFWTAGIPDPDLLIRTGGKDTVRLSNFLLFQMAYTEFQFVDYYWPDLTEERLEKCLEIYKKASRNFGK
jgi:undecaprenyl diphosphate synthase